MAGVIAIAVTVGSAIGTAVSAVAAVVGTVVSAVGAALAAVGSWIATAVTAAYVAVAEAVADFAAGFLFTETAGFQGMSVAGESFFLQVGAYVGSVVYAFTAFLEAIHFTTLLTIHEIAYMVSEDYRAMWVKIYSELGSISYYLGYSADFLNLLIRDARSLVLDTSAMLGKKYDLAEIAWTYQFQSYLRIFSDQAKTYIKNPAAVFHDIDRLLTKPAVDAKAGAMQTVYLTIDSTLKFTKTTVDEVGKVRDDLGSLVSHLPNQIRAEIQPVIDKVFKTWDDWILKDYKPALKIIDGVIGVVSAREEENYKRNKDLADRLKKPGTYLKAIYDLPSYEWPSEEKAVADIATESWSKERQESYEMTKPYGEELPAFMEMLKKERPKVEWAIFELEVPGRPAGAPVEPRKTWNVGDY